MENIDSTFEPKEWISHLLTAAQLIERRNVDLKKLLTHLYIDLDTAIPLEPEPSTVLAYDDLKTCIRAAQSKMLLKGDKLYAYYRISTWIRAQKNLRVKAHQIRQELRKITKHKGDRIYTIAIRTGQLMDALGPPYMRTFGLISPDLIYRIRKTEWDLICDHAITVTSQATLVEEIVELTSQELSVQGGNGLLGQNSP